VTPELAVEVVRNFILPMFETEGKKILRNRSVTGKKTETGQILGGSS